MIRRAIGRVGLAVTAAVDAVVNLLTSTAFRHRIVVLLVPVAAEVVTAIQGAVTGVYPDGPTRVAIDTLALAIVNWLRGRAAPA